MFFYILLSWQIIFVRQIGEQETNDFLTNTRNHCEEIHKLINNSKMTDEDFLNYTMNNEIFKSLKNDELVISVSLSRKKYYKLLHNSSYICLKKKDFVEINFLYLNKKFGKKLDLQNFVSIGIKKLKQIYNLKDDCVMIAYLDPNYSFINESFDILYSIGFNKGTFYEDEPCAYKKLLDMYDSSYDPLEIIKNPSICNIKGNYMALFNTYKKFASFKFIEAENNVRGGVDLCKLLTSRV